MALRSHITRVVLRLIRTAIRAPGRFSEQKTAITTLVNLVRQFRKGQTKAAQPFISRYTTKPSQARNSFQHLPNNSYLPPQRQEKKLFHKRSARSLPVRKSHHLRSKHIKRRMAILRLYISHCKRDRNQDFILEVLRDIEIFVNNILYYL